jgi:hypothetical protein
MCTLRKEDMVPNAPGTARSVCPACGTPEAVLQPMTFLDPHGVERRDDSLWRCSAGRHSFAAVADGLRLISADGRIVRGGQVFPGAASGGCAVS